MVSTTGMCRSAGRVARRRAAACRPGALRLSSSPPPPPMHRQMNVRLTRYENVPPVCVCLCCGVLPVTGHGGGTAQGLSHPQREFVLKRRSRRFKSLPTPKESTHHHQTRNTAADSVRLRMCGWLAGSPAGRA